MKSGWGGEGGRGGAREGDSQRDTRKDTPLLTQKYTHTHTSTRTRTRTHARTHARAHTHTHTHTHTGRACLFGVIRSGPKKTTKKKHYTDGLNMSTCRHHIMARRAAWWDMRRPFFFLEEVMRTGYVNGRKGVCVCVRAHAYAYACVPR